MDTKKLLRELQREFPSKLPKTIAEQGDLLYKVTNARLELARTVVAYLSELETALVERLEPSSARQSAARGENNGSN